MRWKAAPSRPSLVLARVEDVGRSEVLDDARSIKRHRHQLRRKRTAAVRLGIFDGGHVQLPGDPEQRDMGVVAKDGEDLAEGLGFLVGDDGFVLAIIDQLKEFSVMTDDGRSACDRPVGIPGEHGADRKEHRLVRCFDGVERVSVCLTGMAILTTHACDGVVGLVSMKRCTWACGHVHVVMNRVMLRQSNRVGGG